MRRPVIAGNWKMYKEFSDVVSYAARFAKAIADVRDSDIIICPPFIYLRTLVEAFKDTPVSVGAQIMYWEDKGAYTGEISGPMLKSTGVEYVIIGHSERRQYFGETDDTVNLRIKAALRNHIIPILCVGETLEQRENSETFDVIDRQLLQGLDSLEAASAESIIVAYEPVWAIGTGKTATPEIAQEVHERIRHVLSSMFGSHTAEEIRILYGGSVKPDNVDELMRQKDIDGALVGGASLDPESFERIVRYKE